MTFIKIRHHIQVLFTSLILEILVKSLISKLLLYQSQHPSELFFMMYEVLILGWRKAQRDGHADEYGCKILN